MKAAVQNWEFRNRDIERLVYAQKQSLTCYDCDNIGWLLVTQSGPSKEPAIAY
jgi:hypothetical protein